MKRLVLIGGGREGLETLAHAVRQHEWSVAMVIDPDPGALVFRLGDLGYRFADAYAVPLDRRLEAVRDVVPLELAVDATSDRATRRALRQVAPTLDVVGSAAARLLWTLAELPPEERAAQSLKLVKPVADQVDVSTPGELAWLIAETARLVGGADVARVHRWDDARQRLVPLGARGGPPTVSSTAIRVVRDRRVVAASDADRATAWLLEDDDATAAVAAPIQSDEERNPSQGGLADT